LILKGLKFNSFLAKNCKPSIYRALEKRVESQVKNLIHYVLADFFYNQIPNAYRSIYCSYYNLITLVRVISIA
jgi:hypothetical protein